DPDLRPRLEGRIVLVGAPPSGPADLYRTALGETVPRTMIHAALIEQALARTSLRRDLSSDWAEVAALALTGLILMAAMALGGPGWALTAAIIAGGTVAAASWFAFTEGALLVDATYPLAGTAILLLLLTVWWRTVAQRPARAIGQSLGHSVSAETLARVVARGPQADLDGSTRPVSVLVCDIRNFGAMTQGMTGPAVVEMMNRIFGTLGDEILAEGGTLDKVVGDALLAFWNAPLDQPDHPVMAARAALRLRGALARYNARTAGVGQAGGLPSVALTMGVASGMGWVGRIGPHGRLAYSVLGDTVSQAARVETACRHVGYDILLGGEAARRARDLAVLDAGSLQLRGGRVDTAILVGAEPLAASTAFRDLEACHLTLLRAIRDDDAARMAARLAECRGLAASVEPGLAAFYDRIDRRTQDYR
ncbi:MAG TPA: adenylate/guanylate cyclase domain-containing protein, partial [Paracoccaceae bacterium]|nr:adenylate/guanylate cyclase domain-containing protein [Paracoccaceae bacterium]